MTSRKYRKPLHPQTHEILTNVYLYLQNERELFRNNSEKKYFRNIGQRSMKATGIAPSTITRILNKADEKLRASTSKNTVVTPKTKKSRPTKTYLLDLKDFHYANVRRIIYDTQLNSREKLSIMQLARNLLESINFKGSTATLKRIIDQMGFYYTSAKDRTKALIEKHNVRLKRLKYLDEIKGYRAVNRNIVYANISFFGKRSKKRTLHILVVMFAGNEDGFLPGSFFACESTCETGAYHTAVCNDLLERWLRSRLIPSLPSESVLVVDDTPVFNKYAEIPPGTYCSKQTMIDWLKLYDVSVDTNLTKPEIYDSVLRVKEGMEYLIDKILTEQGHHVLRVPPYHTDFNPADAIWTQLESHVNDNSNECSTLLDMKQILITKVKSFSKQEWKMACEYSIQSEDHFRVIEEEIDKLTDSVQLGSESCIEISDDEDTTEYMASS